MEITISCPTHHLYITAFASQPTYDIFRGGSNMVTRSSAKECNNAYSKCNNLAFTLLHTCLSRYHWIIRSFVYTKRSLWQQQWVLDFVSTIFYSPIQFLFPFKVPKRNSFDVYFIHLLRFYWRLYLCLFYFVLQYFLLPIICLCTFINRWAD